MRVLGFITSVISILLLLPGGILAQCDGGGEVCFQESTQESGTKPFATTLEHSDSAEGINSQSTTIVDEVTIETFSEEQAELVAGITRDLKRRNLTRPTGNNAYEKILRLQELHPKHDYAVNGRKYIARILVLLGRQAAGRGDLALASRHLIKALKYDPKVRRQSELRKTIADATRKRETKLKTEEASPTAYLPTDDSKKSTPGISEEIKFVAPVMVAIPAGNFLMGSETGAEDEKPVHHVTVEALSMSKHEITMQQYRVFALATGRPAPQYMPEESNLPATHVSWHDAVAYTQWLSKKTRRFFRLPTESEWEYAARAGTTSMFFTGNSLLKAANCVDCGVAWSGESAAPVGSFQPNEFGLYDTHGNVWEWVADCWSDNYNGRNKNASAVEFEDCDRRVLRGGSWYNDSDYARSSYRGNEKSSFRDSGVGFRVVHEGL